MRGDKRENLSLFYIVIMSKVFGYDIILSLNNYKFWYCLH